MWQLSNIKMMLIVIIIFHSLYSLNTSLYFKIHCHLLIVYLYKDILNIKPICKCKSQEYYVTFIHIGLLVIALLLVDEDVKLRKRICNNKFSERNRIEKLTSSCLNSSLLIFFLFLLYFSVTYRYWLLLPFQRMFWLEFLS